MVATLGRGYRGGRYKGRSAGSRVVLYGLILAVASVGTPGATTTTRGY